MSELQVARDGDCWRLTLARPEKANALSASLVEALTDAVAEAHAAQAAVIAFQGEGRNFSAGFDFSGYEGLSEEALVERFVRVETLLQAVAASSALTVAFAHGRNFGAGVDLFAACRWRIAAPGAAFRMPGLAFGLVLGTRRFAAIVGPARAHDILSSLATFDADAALAMGFTRATVAAESWPAVVEEAQRTAALLPAPSRRLLQEALEVGDGARDMELLRRSASAPGLRERIAAYLARRGA
jgi:enoyl-CoA hydratase